MPTIEVSDETYEKIKDQLEADKKAFKPIRICHITVSVSDNISGNAPISIEGDCHQAIKEAKKTIKAIRSAIDFAEQRNATVDSASR